MGKLAFLLPRPSELGEGIQENVREKERQRNRTNGFAGEAQGKRTGGIPRMIVNMSREATEEQIEHVIERIKECGYQAHVIRGAERTVIGAVGSGGRRAELEALQAAPGVEELVPISQPFKLVSRNCTERTVVDVGGVTIGGEQLGGDGRAVFGGVARATAGDGARRARRGRLDAARRRLQAAHFAVRLSGAGRRGAGAAARSARRDRAADRDRGDEHRGRGPGLRVRRHAAGGRAQHAELPAAAAPGAGGAARCC